MRTTTQDRAPHKVSSVLSFPSCRRKIPFLTTPIRQTFQPSKLRLLPLVSRMSRQFYAQKLGMVCQKRGGMQLPESHINSSSFSGRGLVFPPTFYVRGKRDKYALSNPRDPKMRAEERDERSFFSLFFIRSCSWNQIVFSLFFT